MYIDARGLTGSETIETEICIAGSGPAGMAIAMSLERAGIACIVLESGGLKRDEATADLNRGESAGVFYEFADGHRSRFLGGSSNCWGGFCRPWDEQAFVERPWVANSGWPIGLPELDPYYRHAEHFLGLSPHGYDSATWMAFARQQWRVAPAFAHDRQTADRERVEEIITQLSPSANLGQRYGKHLLHSSLVQVYLYANVVDLRLEADSCRVAEVLVHTLNGVRLRVRAQRVVLATGGIENARLLLNANTQHEAGLGNAHDVVGRYFQDHPRIRWGVAKVSPPYRNNPLFDIKFHCIADDLVVNGQRIGGQFRLPFALQRREELLDAQVWLRSAYAGESIGLETVLQRLRLRATGARSMREGLGPDVMEVARHPVRSAAYVASHLTRSRWAVRRVGLDIIAEPEPNPESRVLLSEHRDALGLRRARIDWRLSGNVWRTMRRSVELISADLAARQIAVVTSGGNPPIDAAHTPFEGTYHHMGTTRMHDSPRLGVVDRDCRVHGIANLFIAGSSVFPTCSSNHPTITLVALAMRLADNLKARVSAGP